MSKIDWMYKHNTLVLDMDVTGNNPEDEVISFAVINQDKEILMHELTRPYVKRYWSKAEEKCGISPRMVKGESPFYMYAEQLNSILYDCDYLLVYDFAKKIRYLPRWNDQETWDGLYLLLERKHLIDVGGLYAAFIRRNYLYYPGRFEFVSLEHCCRKYGIQMNEKFSSLGSCYFILAVYREMRKEILQKETDDNILQLFPEL